MDAAEAWVVGVGVVGLAAFAGGSLVMALPPVDAPDDEVVGALVRRRSAILAGATLAVLGAALLLWPLADGGLALVLGALGGAKVVTVLVEVAGTGRRTGRNAGGWALGSSGDVTVTWFAALLLVLAVG